MRAMPQRRLRPVTVALITAAALSIGAPVVASAPAIAATSTSAPGARIDTAVRIEAAEIADAAAALQQDVAATMSGYTRSFRGDLTRDERRVLDSYVETANKRLTEVVRETARLERAARGRSVAQVEQAQARSQSAWARAQMAAEESFESARSILEPHMSLGDRIEALADYTVLMGRFEDLGERIDTLDLD